MGHDPSRIRTDIKYTTMRSRRYEADVNDSSTKGKATQDGLHYEEYGSVSPVHRTLSMPFEAGTVPVSPLAAETTGPVRDSSPSVLSPWASRDGSLFTRMPTGEKGSAGLARAASVNSVTFANSADGSPATAALRSYPTTSPLHRAMSLAPLTGDASLPSLNDRTTWTLAMTRGSPDQAFGVNDRPESPYKSTLPPSRTVYRSADVSYISDRSVSVLRWCCTRTLSLSAHACALVLAVLEVVQRREHQRTRLVAAPPPTPLPPTTCSSRRQLSSPPSFMSCRQQPRSLKAKLYVISPLCAVFSRLCWWCGS